jgi:uroporphyrinogen-III decarboxylase
MSVARQTLGNDRKVQGNIDPMVLFGTQELIEREVKRCLLEAGPKGHILNVGHGVVQGTPEENVAWFCELARRSGGLFAAEDAKALSKAAAAERVPVGAV